MTKPRLSLCIPTYNRADYLDQLLRSIWEQSRADVEVIVADNASTDNTSDIVRDWQGRIPYVRYCRSETNRGADENFIVSVEEAKGEFCWIIGSDDVVAPGAIQLVSSYLSGQADCLLFGRLLCTIDMDQIEPHCYWKFPGERLFDFSRDPLADYIRECTSIAGIFSFLSATIFRRELWTRDSLRRRLVGTAYVHADILLRQISAGSKLLASPNIVVYCRCGNDSFSTGSKGKRLSLDFDGFRKIAAALPPREAYEVKQLLLREHRWRSLIHVFRYKRLKGELPDFVALITDGGVSRARMALYSCIAKNPWFKVFLFVEPWFKKDSPFRRLQRYLRKLSYW